MSAHSSGYINLRDMNHGGTSSVTLGTDGSTFSGPTAISLSSAANWVDFYSSGTTAYRVNMDISHTHKVTASGTVGNHRHSISSSGSLSMSGTIGSGNTETRPGNYTVKIWKRTA